jgi:L-arabinose transport system permease protein
VMKQTNSVALGILAGVGSGGVVGLVNGLIVAKGKINPLITTLATMQIVRGLAYLISEGKAVGVSQESFFALGDASFLGLAAPVWLCLACFVGFGILLQCTTFGRYTLAIGGNEAASRLTGVPVVRTKIIIFTLQGLVAAFAGVVLAARMTSGQPMSSQGFELEVISACVLGGVSLAGGVGKMGFVIAGVLIMGMVQNVMNLLNVPPFYQYVARGLILLGAVSFDRVKQVLKI